MRSSSSRLLSALAMVAVLALASVACSSKPDTAPSCAYTAVPTPGAFGVTGGVGTLAIATTAECAWEVTSDSAWLTFPGVRTGKGTQAIPFAVAANPANIPRKALVGTSAGAIEITQAAAPCAYAVTPESVRMTNEGGSTSVAVTTTEPCPWIATSDQPWIRITSSPSGSGSGMIQITLDRLFEAIGRSGAVTIAARRVNVTQDGTGCTITITPTTVSPSAAGGSATIAVTAGESCTWTAASQNVWIAINGDEAGSGNGTISYTVAPNMSADERVGRITVGGLTLYITQAGQ